MKSLIQSLCITVFLIAAFYFGWYEGPKNIPGLPTQSASGTAEPWTGDTIRIATFNIQVFGRSKMSKPQVMDILAKTIRRFDVVAIQEIRSSDQTIIPKFVDMINADGSNYRHVLGPRLGRTVSKEQYAYLYNSDRIQLVEDSVYTVNDPNDMLHREPLVARFVVRGPPENSPTSFTLINIHTDPDEVGQEINVLDNVFALVKNDGRGEDDIILLGDLNANERQFGELGRVQGLAWVVRDAPTNTRMNRTYDNIVFDSRATAEFTGNSGVLNLMSEYGLSEAAALQVSDHMPVWAEFRAIEAGGQRSAASNAETTTR